MENRGQNTFRSFCGCAKRGGMPIPSCEYYDPLAGQCLLLRDRKMDEFWEKGPCAPFEMLYDSVSDCLERFKKKYAHIPIDEREDVDFCKLVSRLKRQGLTREFNSVGWRRYVNKAVYREVKEILVRRGLIAGAANCGSCKHLSLSRPHVCRKTGELRKKSQAACDRHMWRSHVFLAADSENADILNGNAVKNEMARRGGEHMRTPAMLVEEKEEGGQVFRMKKMLAERVNDAKAGTKRKERYERQYEVFANLMSLFSDGVSERNAISVLAEKTGIHTKTIRRDVKEIRLFLKAHSEA